MTRTLIAALLLGLVGCSKEEPAKPASPPVATAAPVAAPTEPPNPMPKGDRSAPRLSLSVDHSVRPVLYRGWPAWAAVDVDPPSSAKIELSGPWPWTPTATGWRLTAEQTAAIDPGNYKVKATAGAAAVEIPIEVRDEPKDLTAEERLEKLGRQAEALAEAGKDEEVLTLARGAKDTFPSAALPWRLEGDALLRTGRKPEAAASYREALARHRKTSPKSPPPALLLRSLREAEASK